MTLRRFIVLGFKSSFAESDCEVGVRDQMINLMDAQKMPMRQRWRMLETPSGSGNQFCVECAHIVFDTAHRLCFPAWVARFYKMTLRAPDVILLAQ
jgi:hypothetical protein